MTNPISKNVHRPETDDVIRTSATTSDHRQRTWYAKWKFFWISLAILALYVLSLLLEMGVIVCVWAFVAGMTWNIPVNWLHVLLIKLSFFLSAMFAVSYWYIIMF